MRLPIFQVDAFTREVFGGNPAAVIPLEEWLPEETMQAIAMENNLAETAYIVPEEGSYRIRWFTPEVEIELCGHATLASAHVLFNHGFVSGDAIEFISQSGVLRVTRDGDLLTLNFPGRSATSTDRIAPRQLQEAMGIAPVATLDGKGLLLVYETQADIENLKPDFEKIRALDDHAVTVTAPGDNCDFVSRFFAPTIGIPEDPVTGSAHCALVPYWAKRLDRTKLHARQLSARGGELFCELVGDRVRMSGYGVEYLRGEIEIQSGCRC